MSLKVKLLCGLLLAASGAVPAMADTPNPPVAKRVDHRSTWHGETFIDPYFWLRDKSNPDVIKYLEGENAYTAAMTKELKPFEDALYAEALGRIKQTDLSVPARKGGFYYYARTIEGQQYPIRCRKPAGPGGIYDDKAAEEVLLDLNALAKGHPFLGLGHFAVSDDGRYLAYTTDTSGFRQYTLAIKDLKTGRLLPHSAPRVTSVEWSAGSGVLFFTSEDEVTKRSDTLWRMRLGGPAAAPPERLFVEQDALYTVELERTRDRRYLLLSSTATDTWETRVLDAREPLGTFRVVLPRRKGHKYALAHRDGVVYLRTNQDAKNFRVVLTTLADPSEKTWRPFLPHRADVLLQDLSLFKNHAVATQKREGLVFFSVYDFASAKWRQVRFSEPVYTAGPSDNAEFDSRTFRYAYQSFVTPPSVLDHDLASGKDTLLKRQEVLGGYDPAHYVTRRLWARARDGARIPISIVHRKGFKRHQNGALWLYGYGSYGYGMPVTFVPSRPSVLDRGVAFAIAHIRGGNELGEAWHDHGMLLEKKNTFNDFIDSAAFLVDEGWATPDRLVIEGASAGGLLMGAVVNARPNFFRAVLTAVPFVDVLNTMMDASLPLTVGEYLEWGNPNEKNYFDYMRSYSPYDNLDKKAYPAMLVITSLHDSQVMYWEPAKYVAKLRTLKTDTNPLLLKINMGAGHGGASGRYDNLRERAFQTAWMLSRIGITR